MWLKSLLDPASPHAEFRGEEYGDTHKDYAGQQVYANLAELRAVKDRIKINHLEIKLYHGTPIFTVYAADNEMFVGFYWRHLAATEGPQLEIQGDSPLGQQVHRHFDDLWKTAQSVQLSDQNTVARSGQQAHQTSPPG